MSEVVHRLKSLNMKSEFSKGTIDSRLFSDYPGLGIVLMDMQEKCLENVPSEDTARLISAVDHVIGELCHNSNVPLILVTYAGCGDLAPQLSDSAKSLTFIKYHVKETANWFDKSSSGKYSALPKFLNDAGIESLLFCGVYASVCIYQSAVNARRKGFDVITAGTLIEDSFFLKAAGPDKSKASYIMNDIDYYDSHIDFMASLSKR